jgi:hypothetical protein
MMALGFAGLAFAGYRRAKARHAAVAHLEAIKIMIEAADSPERQRAGPYAMRAGSRRLEGR